MKSRICNDIWDKMMNSRWKDIVFKVISLDVVKIKMRAKIIKTNVFMLSVLIEHVWNLLHTCYWHWTLHSSATILSFIFLSFHKYTSSFSFCFCSFSRVRTQIFTQCCDRVALVWTSMNEAWQIRDNCIEIFKLQRLYTSSHLFETHEQILSRARALIIISVHFDLACQVEFKFQFYLNLLNLSVHLD